MLDEPTEALDQLGKDWLLKTIDEWDRALIVASHDRPLLRHFQHFLILGESGGRYFQGSFEELENDLEKVNALKEKKYVQNLRVLADKEWHNARVWSSFVNARKTWAESTK